MKLVADESVDWPVIDALRQAQFDVTAIVEIAPGTPDEVVLSRSVTEKALLLTADKDFGDLVYRQGLTSYGVVLVRISGVSQELRVALVMAAFRTHSSLFPGNLTVIEPGGLRVRRLLLQQPQESRT